LPRTPARPGQRTGRTHAEGKRLAVPERIGVNRVHLNASIAHFAGDPITGADDTGPIRNFRGIFWMATCNLHRAINRSSNVHNIGRSIHGEARKPGKPTVDPRHTGHGDLARFAPGGFSLPVPGLIRLNSIVVHAFEKS